MKEDLRYLVSHEKKLTFFELLFISLFSIIERYWFLILLIIIFLIYLIYLKRKKTLNIIFNFTWYKLLYVIILFFAVIYYLLEPSLYPPSGGAFILMYIYLFLRIPILILIGIIAVIVYLVKKG